MDVSTSPIFTIVLFFTLHKTAKIRGRVTSNRDFFLIILDSFANKKAREASRSICGTNQRMEISFSLWLMERIFLYIIQLPFLYE